MPKFPQYIYIDHSSLFPFTHSLPPCQLHRLTRAIEVLRLEIANSSYADVDVEDTPAQNDIDRSQDHEMHPLELLALERRLVFAVLPFQRMDEMDEEEGEEEEEEEIGKALEWHGTGNILWHIERAGPKYVASDGGEDPDMG